MNRRRALILGVSGAVWAGQALAQERPAIVPSRDVEVVYQIKGPAGPIQERWRFRAADQVARLEIDRGAYMLSDMRAHVATMVNDRDRQVIRVPMPSLGPAGISGRDFTRIGAASIAGVPCTEWQTIDLRGQEVIACMTTDGVMLRARQGTQTVVEAATVSYAAQDPATFAVPPGYQRVAPPARQ